MQTGQVTVHKLLRPGGEPLVQAGVWAMPGDGGSTIAIDQEIEGAGYRPVFLAVRITGLAGLDV